MRPLNGVPLTELQRHADELPQNPADWIPWNHARVWRLGQEFMMAARHGRKSPAAVSPESLNFQAAGIQKPSRRS
jgi:hypothetical protein